MQLCEAPVSKTIRIRWPPTDPFNNVWKSPFSNCNIFNGVLYISPIIIHNQCFLKKKIINTAEIRRQSAMT